MIKVKIVGAGGYGGVGMVELLLNHPHARIVRLAAINDVGIPINQLYPHLDTFCDLPITDATEPDTETADVVFMATPDGVGMRLAPEALAAGAKVIDYSGDFRFNTPEAYADYAGRIGRDQTHASPELLKEAVYGLTELHREDLNPQTRLVGNPGCFAVSCTLGLAPAFKERLINPARVICDCKSGVSGAGKKVSPAFHFPARYENLNAYKLAGHQHVCEVERQLSLLSGQAVKVTFTAQVLPICRGIMSTLYGELNAGVTLADILEAYHEYYKNATFVKLYKPDSGIGTIHVRGTNFCKIIVDADKRTGTLRIVSHIDNLLKGQAGSALQNMNLLFGLPEDTGLKIMGRYP